MLKPYLNEKAENKKTSKPVQVGICDFCKKPIFDGQNHTFRYGKPVHLHYCWFKAEAKEAKQKTSKTLNVPFNT